MASNPAVRPMKTSRERRAASSAGGICSGGTRSSSTCEPGEVGGCTCYAMCMLRACYVHGCRPYTVRTQALGIHVCVRAHGGPAPQQNTQCTLRLVEVRGRAGGTAARARAAARKGRMTRQCPGYDQAMTRR